MRLAFLVSSLWLSGGVNAVVEYAARLRQRGHEVTIVVPRGTVDDVVAQRLGTAVPICEAGPPGVRVGSGLISKIWLNNELASAVPPSDVIIATHTPTALAALLATRRSRGARPVWFYQDYAEMFVGRPVEQIFLHMLPRYFHEVLTVSESAAAEMRRYGARCVSVVRQGLSDEAFFVPAPDGAPRERGLLLYLGDMRPRKGLFDFLGAVELIYPEEPHIHLAIVAKSETQVETRIPMHLYYRPPRLELAQLYQRCEIFVSASWWESFGLPPLEAMACGAPVVLTQSRGVSEYACPEENCVMVPPRDPQALGLAIQRVLRDPVFADRIAKAGSVTAKDYQWDECVDRFEAAVIQSE